MVLENVTTEMKEKIRLVVKEYIERVLKNCETLQGCTTDYNIDCPKCGGHRTIFWSGGRRGYWNACWKCRFRFSKDLIPPSPEELKELCKTRQKERRMRELTEFIKGLGIALD